MPTTLGREIDQVCEDWQERRGPGRRTLPDKDKIIQDPVHGPIEIEKELLFLLDSVMMQRLRRISQLGLASLVFPGANHTRFEHSLGVMHLVGRVLERLAKTERSLTQARIRETKAAALLHDVGHLPFSHVAEPLLENDRRIHAELESQPKLRPSELLTMKIIQSSWMRDVFRILNRRMNCSLDVDNIANLAVGHPPIDASNMRYLGELIHGDFDLDRVDYLARDAYCTGVPLGTVDVERLLRTVCLASGLDRRKYPVIDIKGLHSLESMIVARSMMYSAVYFHHSVRAANGMLNRAIYTRFRDEPLELLRHDNSSLFTALSRRNDKARSLTNMLRSRNIFKPALIIRTNNAKDKNALMQFVQNTSFPETVRIENLIDVRVANDRKKYVILDMPKVEIYSEIQMNIRNREIIAPVRDFSYIVKGIEQDSDLKWIGYVFGPSGNIPRVRTESIRRLRDMGLTFSGI